MSLANRLRARWSRLLARHEYAVLIDSTNCCNLRCSFCPRSYDAPRMMTTVEFETIIRKLRPQTRTLQLSCAWEYSVAKNPDEIILALGRHEFPSTSIYSNGNLLPSSVANALITAEIDEFVVSIGEATQSTYEKVRLGGRFQSVVDNLRSFAELKRCRAAALPRVSANLTLINSNLDELPDFIGFAAELGIETVRGRHLILNDGLDMSDEVVIDVQHGNEKITQARQRAADLGIGFAVPFYGEGQQPKQCRAAWQQLYISSNGDVSVCPRIHKYVTIGNLINDSLSEMEHSMALKQLRRQFTEGFFENPVCSICIDNQETHVPINQGF